MAKAERLERDLTFALELMETIDRETTSRFGALDLHVDLKADHTPVSDADRHAEETVRRALLSERPGDEIYGEEQGGSLEHAHRRWILDPIDGTKNFIRGVPVWATLLGLEEDGEIVLGVVSAPALGRRWWARAEGGAFTGGSLVSSHQIHVSTTDALRDASLSYSSLTGWKERGLRSHFLELTDQCWRTRAYGDFWSYMLVAEGVVDLAMEPELEIYDMAALVPIVTEAGGRFTSLRGEHGPWGGDAIASNGLLHDAALSLMTR